VQRDSDQQQTDGTATPITTLAMAKKGGADGNSKKAQGQARKADAAAAKAAAADAAKEANESAKWDKGAKSNDKK
jgi:hypothetical protein